ncbi:hypothetical protein ACFXTN_020017 [Malus domestica]
MLTLEITKPTWRAGRIYSKLTTSFGDCGGANSSAEAQPRSKFVDVALSALLTSVSCDCGRGRNNSRPLGLSSLKTRLLICEVHEPNSAYNVPNVITVTPHLAEKANEMTSTNKDSKTLLDRDLDRQSTVLAAVLLMPTEDTARPTDSTVTELSMPT